jgi:aryl-alcohol dehydrogenase-like predicted oxidoreductase
LALAWLLGVPEITGIVVGPTRVDQLTPVREALSLELSTEEHAHLRGLFP